MRPTLAREVIFESTLEARVAARLLYDGGRAELMDDIEPPLEQPLIGQFEFLGRLHDERKGRGDKAEYIIRDPDTGIALLGALFSVAEPSRPGELTLSRKKYIGQKLIGFMAKLEELRQQRARTLVVEIGGISIMGLTGDEADLLKRREALAMRYITARGWDRNNLTEEQFIEIRSQPGWQDPPETPQS